TMSYAVVSVPEDHRRETVHGFATRRLGREFADTFMHPMILGITSGDAAQTNLDALFPRMRALEVDHGSLLGAMVAKMRAKLLEGSSPDEGGPAGPGGRLTSFGPGGVQVLLNALAQHLGDARLRLNTQAVQIVRNGDSERRWRVVLDDGETLEADAVVVATPSYVAARLVEGQMASLAEALDTIPYASVRVLALGFDAGAIPGRMDGFGFLVPRGQGVRILGCLWTSTIFPSQAPHDKVLLRVIAGGAFDPGFVELSDEEALWETRRDLSRTMGITKAPEFVRHVRWPRAIPQYGPDHLNRVDRIDQHLNAVGPGLFVAGNAYKGIGLNDCVRNARHTALDVIQMLPR
ncbi:MAG: protoporphyrinogen oxidase, partial [Myxococcota bacterium]